MKPINNTDCICFLRLKVRLVTMSCSKAEPSEPVPTPARGLLGAAWRSSNGKKTPRWTHPEAIKLGKSFKDHLPQVALDLVKKGTWSKGPLIILEDKSGLKATKADLETNFVWVRAVFILYTDRTPSAYLIADGLLELDKELEGKLILPDKDYTTKSAKALAEALKIRLVASWGRYLWTHNPSGGGPKIEELKSLLTESPQTKRRRAKAEAEAAVPEAATQVAPQDCRWAQYKYNMCCLYVYSGAIGL